MRMFQMTKRMTFDEFVGFIEPFFQGDARPGHVNSESGLMLKDFIGWEDWFSFGGGLDKGSRLIGVIVDEEDTDKIAYLAKHGFKRV